MDTGKRVGAYRMIMRTGSLKKIIECVIFFALSITIGSFLIEIVILDFFLYLFNLGSNFLLAGIIFYAFTGAMLLGILFVIVQYFDERPWLNTGIIISIVVFGLWLFAMLPTAEWLNWLVDLF